MRTAYGPGGRGEAFGESTYFGEGGRTRLAQVNAELSPKLTNAVEGYLTSNKGLKESILGKTKKKLADAAPDMHASTSDLERLLKGRNASKKFLRDNQPQLERFLQTALGADDALMVGYEEFSNETQMRDGELQVPGQIPSVAQSSAGGGDELDQMAANSVPEPVIEEESGTARSSTYED